MAMYPLSVCPPLLLLPPALEQISTRLPVLGEQQAPGVTAFLLGTYPDEVRTALRTSKPNDAVTSTFWLDVVMPVYVGRDICASRGGGGGFGILALV